MKGGFIVSLKLRDGEISSVLVSNNIVLQDSEILYWQVKKEFGREKKFVLNVVFAKKINFYIQKWHNVCID